jgi:hypothetical protein
MVISFLNVGKSYRDIVGSYAEHPKKADREESMHAEDDDRGCIKQSNDRSPEILKKLD